MTRMRPANLLFFLSDNHARGALGCYGNPVVHTPVLDSIAALGTRFANAYTASPLCCPARAAIATGRFPYQTGYWDNAIVYDGRVPSWMHRLREAGSEVVSVGKLHFRSTEDDNGFSQELAPMHILNAKGGVSMLLRWSDEEPINRGQWELYLEQSGVGSTHYQEYDLEISRLAIDWLAQRATRAGRDAAPWALFVSYVSPHPPFTVPQELLDLYPFDKMPLPPMFREHERPQHPSLAHLRRIMGFKAMDDEAALRRIAACYYAVVTHIDRQIGRVLHAAGDLGLLDNTRVIYTSDHGEALGAHGLFGKANLLEPGAGIPMLMCGPDVPAGRVETAPVSQVDLYPTIVEGAGLSPIAAEADLPGRSLFHSASRSAPVFAEYHAAGSRRGVSMLRDGAYKLIHHVDAPPQLFNLANDPDERHDLGALPSAAPKVAALEEALHAICDPAQVDARARADQRAKALYWGGNEAILKEGLLVYTPPPGVSPEVRASAG
ncbi:MAG: sulfatase-like hydrolase/transferase [Burkholderiales bacterium]